MDACTRTPTLDKEGYSRCYWLTGPKRGTGTGAHRVVWTFERGPIPRGLTIHHTCYNPRCLNVEHMRLLSASENSKRNRGADWDELGVCRRGHPDSDRRADGRCRSCRKGEYLIRKGVIEDTDSGG